MKYAYFYETNFCRIGISDNGLSGEETAITHLFFGNSVAPSSYEIKETRIIKEAAQQLVEYLDGKRTTFHLPLQPSGTDFEQSVWNALLKIPYGTTKSYGEIAQQIGHPKASRAVGRAIGRNPISIFIPCHRVIGKNGNLTGYAGGLEHKIKLLKIEGIDI